MAIKFPGIKDALRGGLIYGTGDTIASLITGTFNPLRVLGIVCVGATIYAIEITGYFSWIDGKSQSLSGIKAKLLRMSMAMMYFNPLWIARHLLFISLFSGTYFTSDSSFLLIGFKSFFFNIPVSLTANYIIQNKVSLKYRFMSSSIFSACMAVYYALSAVLFK